MTIIILFSSFRFWFRTSFDTHTSGKSSRKDSTQTFPTGPGNQYIPHPFFQWLAGGFFTWSLLFLGSKDTTIIWRTKNRLENLCLSRQCGTSASNFVGGGTWIPQLRELKKRVAAMVEQLIVASFFGSSIHVKNPLGYLQHISSHWPWPTRYKQICEIMMGIHSLKLTLSTPLKIGHSFGKETALVTFQPSRYNQVLKMLLVSGGGGSRVAHPNSFTPWM